MLGLSLAEKARTKCINYKNVARFLNKYTRPALADFASYMAKQYPNRDATDITNAKTKSGFVQALKNAYFTEGITHDEAAHLDLTHCQKYSGKTKSWCALSLQIEPQKGDRGPSTDEKILLRQIYNELTAYYEHYVSASTLDDAIWIRIVLDNAQSRIPTSRDVTYVVFFPHTKYLLLSRRASEQYILHALKAALKCSDIKDCELQTNSVDVMKELLLHQHSQGAHRKLRRKMKFDNPLDRKPKRPKLEPKPSPVKRDDADIIKKRKEHIERLFGEGDEEQPALNQANFTMTGRFHGGESVGTTTESDFMIGVTLRGPNILEGLKDLAKQGIAVPPFPDFLANLHSYGSNTMELTENT